MLPSTVWVEVEGCELDPLGPVGPEAGLQDPAEVGPEGYGFGRQGLQVPAWAAGAAGN